MVIFEADANATSEPFEFNGSATLFIKFDGNSRFVTLEALASDAVDGEYIALKAVAASTIQTFGFIGRYFLKFSLSGYDPKFGDVRVTVSTNQEAGVLA